MFGRRPGPWGSAGIAPRPGHRTRAARSGRRPRPTSAHAPRGTPGALLSSYRRTRHGWVPALCRTCVRDDSPVPDACRICELNADIASLPSCERLYVDEHWRVSHGWTHLPGWLLVASRRHVTALDELDVDEAQVLIGSYVRRASPSAGSRLREDLRDVVLGTPRGTDTSTSTSCRGCVGSVRPSAPPRLSGSSRPRRRSGCQRTSPSGWPRRSGGRLKGSRHSPARGQAVELS